MLVVSSESCIVLLFTMLTLPLIALLASPLALQDTKSADAPAPAAPAKPAASLVAGSKAPEFKVETFVKGDAVSEFKLGHVYVVEFWATWCGPCIAMMPHMSELQSEYKDKVTFVGVNVWEEREKYTQETLDRVKKFVADQGDKMAYTVAYDGGAMFMADKWMKAAARNGIPSAFLVDGTGTIVWIGHPIALDAVIPMVLDGSWNITEGPKKINEARKEFGSALEAYQTSFEDGEKAWDAACKKYPHFVNMSKGERYYALFAAGHEDRAYPIGRTMLEEAKTKKDSAKMMEVIMPLLSPQITVKNVDRQLALDVANAVYEIGDPTQPNRHVALAQIYYMLGDLEKARENKAKAIELAPAENKQSYTNWLEDLERRSLEKQASAENKDAAEKK